MTQPHRPDDPDSRAAATGPADPTLAAPSSDSAGTSGESDVWQVPPTHSAIDRRPFAVPSAEELGLLFPQYELIELLGAGGMGAVYKARQKALDRLVALKVLPPRAEHVPDFADRFAREARALARLNHPNIVHVHDFGRTTSSGAGQDESASASSARREVYFIVMEFVDGTNLRQALQTRSVAARDALAIVGQVCEALQYAHDEGVIHRDIKPENILIDRKGRVKIVDFGLAKLAGSGSGDNHGDAPALTATGGAMGTPRYMAPEQWTGARNVDHRADIYSLGVVFYELLTGEVPMGRFDAPSKRVDVDVRLDEVVLRSLDRDPERRYQRASEVKTVVEAIGDANVDTDAPATNAAPAAAAPLVATSKEPTVRAGIRWQRPAILCASLGLAAVLWFTFGGANPSQPAVVGSSGGAPGIPASQAPLPAVPSPPPPVTPPSAPHATPSVRPPLAIDTGGLVPETVVVPKAVLPHWQSPGVYARISGRGMLEFPQLAIDRFAVDARIEIHNATSHLAWTLGAPRDRWRAEVLMAHKGGDDAAPTVRCLLSRHLGRAHFQPPFTPIPTRRPIRVRLVATGANVAVYIDDELRRTTPAQPQLWLTLTAHSETASVTIHQIAFRAPTEAELREVQAQVPAAEDPTADDAK